MEDKQIADLTDDELIALHREVTKFLDAVDEIGLSQWFENNNSGNWVGTPKHLQLAVFQVMERRAIQWRNNPSDEKTEREPVDLETLTYMRIKESGQIGYITWSLPDGRHIVKTIKGSYFVSADDMEYVGAKNLSIEEKLAIFNAPDIAK